MRLQILVVIVFFALSGNVFAQSTTDSCNMQVLPTIIFKNTAFLSKKAKLQLDSVVMITKQYPNCNIRVKGFGTLGVKSQQKSWDQVDTIIRYLEKRGISSKKLIFNYGEPGATNMVKFFGTTEKRPLYIGCQRSSLYKSSLIIRDTSFLK